MPENFLLNSYQVLFFDNERLKIDKIRKILREEFEEEERKRILRKGDGG
ncbi:MAG TPA: hypothetical protein VIY47_14555 [Ignavibacteriaceae bacterium]